MNRRCRTNALLSLSLPAIFLTGLGGGCTSPSHSTTASLAAEPEPSPAAQVRSFEPTIALYANGDTVTSGSGQRYAGQRGADSRQYVARDAGVFFANFVTGPFTLFKERNQRFVHQGLHVPPTYTAVPDYPAGTQREAARPFADQIAPVDADATMTTPTTVPSTSSSGTIIITPTETTLGTFTIYGQVSDPGQYKILRAGSTLTQALAASGLEQKDPTKVMITLTRAGSDTSRTFTLDSIADPAADPVLENGDQIVVKINP